MTIAEAIAQADALRPNTCSRELKLAWLSRLDGMIRREILDTHEGGPTAALPDYGPDTDARTVLLVGAPWEALYIRWLEAQIDLANGEPDRYNLSLTVFTDEYRSFENHYHRSHSPKKAGSRFLF